MPEIKGNNAMHTESNISSFTPNETNAGSPKRSIRIRHRGRGAQVGIYLGKLLRMFVYQNDWKVLPMAAVIAGLVGMVIQRLLFITMEGTLMGAFALVMVCIWNGFFNSIQVICRERDVIKREHRSGMHISSYICAHMIYQAMLCLLQTCVTLYVTSLVGVKYPAEGLFTRWMIVDIGISMFLITFASDMMSLWISTIARNTTTAMTIMPFVLIFQLVFSGSIFTLPEWTDSIVPLTISNPSLNLVASQADYNSRPVRTVWEQVNSMRDRELEFTVTLGKVLDILDDEKITAVSELRSLTVDELVEAAVSGAATEAAAILSDSEAADLISADVPGAEAADLLSDDASGTSADELSGSGLTVGDLIDLAQSSPDLEARRDESYTASYTVGDLINLIGEEKAADILQNKISEANYKPEYETSRSNIAQYWLRLMMFILVFAVLATITLEFIDKDKR